MRIGRIVREIEILPDEETLTVPEEPDQTVPSLPQRETGTEEPATP